MAIRKDNTLNKAFLERDSDKRYLGYRGSSYPKPPSLHLQPATIHPWDNSGGFHLTFISQNVWVLATNEYLNAQLKPLGKNLSDLRQYKELGYDAVTEQLIFPVAQGHSTPDGSKPSTGAPKVPIAQTQAPPTWKLSTLKAADATELSKTARPAIGLRNSTADAAPVAALPAAAAKPEDVALGKHGERIVLRLLEQRKQATPGMRLVSGNDEGSNAVGYDFEVYSNELLIELIEVKSTTGPPGTPLKLSARQLEMAVACHVLPSSPAFILYCVYNADKAEPIIQVVEAPLTWIALGKLQLCTDVMVALK